jgi:spermidine synthase
MKSKYILEFAVFMCGAVVMIFELVGSRVIGPFLGTSLFVWTSLIGIILASLSLGYYLGGKQADKNASMSRLARIILLAAICIAVTIGIKDILLLFLQKNVGEIRTASVIASIVLFMPASIFLGMVSPYAAKIKLSSLENTGRTIGNLYALSTAGSIFGTLFAGFYLIPFFGTNKLLIFLAIILVLISIVLSLKTYIKSKVAVLLFLVTGLIAFNFLDGLLIENGFLDLDTSYNRIFITDSKQQVRNLTIRRMGINNEAHSAMYLESDELVSEYAKSYHLIRHFYPDFKSSLMLGGAGYSFPKSYLKTYPNAKIDVVEIDPKVTQLAKDYFKLKEDRRLSIFHNEGRTYLNHTEKTYDIILGDAFSSSYSIPYQLTTQESAQKMHDILNDDGIVILNIISSIEGDSGKFFRAEYATFKTVFPQLFVYPLHDSKNGSTIQNIFLIASKSKDKIYPFSSDDIYINNRLQKFWHKKIPNDLPILTDDFAPVDYYIGAVQSNISKSHMKQGLWSKVERFFNRL